MDKIDFKRTLKALYAPTEGAFVEVDVPVMSFVKADGHGDPNAAGDYQRVVEALYGVSYAMKFAAKSAVGRDYVVPPLEGLWWADDPSAFAARRKNEWHWTMMIMVPEFVTPELFEAAVDQTQKKAGPLPASLRIEPYAEGRSFQTMHVGSYDDEGPALAHLHDQIMPEKSVTFNGPHHEIYISDPRRVAANRLRTVLRQPVKPIS